jgi:hypothetical protein
MMAKFLIIYRMSKCEMNQIRITFPNAIGVGLVNTDRLCYLISAVQIFYHLKDLRTLLMTIATPQDSAFELGQLFRDMATGESRCIPQLQKIQRRIHMEPNHDAVDACRNLLNHIMQSQHPGTTEVMRHLFFLMKLRWLVLTRQM